MTAHAERSSLHGKQHHDERHRRRRSRHVVLIGIGVVGAAVIVVLALVLVTRHRTQRERDARAHELAKGPRLAVATVAMSRAQREIKLPGEVRGFNQATLYGKVSGYVSEMRVDRGDRVKKGDTLAVIRSPEMEEDLRSAESNKVYAQRTAERLDALAKPGVVSMLERDMAVNARTRADADMRRARSLLDYTLVRAPFDGVVTARYVDPGALISAATSSTQAAQPVVDVADLDRVRVFVYLGQDAAPFVKSGDPVGIEQSERPDVRIPASMTRVAGALDPRTRTMQCEIILENQTWHLIPGTFVHVRIGVDVPPSPVVPNEALVTRDGGTPHVALVEGDRVHYRPVEVGANDGKTTRITRGLSGGETVGLDVPVQVAENDLVQPVASRAR
jgi:RND family efflux transporter MFP subunit